MTRIHRSLLPTILGTVAGCAVLACGHGQSPPQREAGVWPLTGNSDIVLSASEKSTVLGTVELPPGAVQGDPDWYWLGLHTQINLVDNPSVSTRGYVSVATGGFAVAIIRIETDGAGALTWSTFSVFEGLQEEHADGGTFELAFTNVLQTSAVALGSFPVEVLVDQSDRLVDSVVVRAESTVFVSRLGPPHVDVELNFNGTRPDADADSGLLVVEASARGLYPDQMKVAVSGVGAGVDVEPSSKQLIDVKRHVRAEFTVTIADSSDPVVEVTTEIGGTRQKEYYVLRPSANGSGRRWWLLTAAAACATLGIISSAAGIVSQLRSKRTTP